MIGMEGALDDVKRGKSIKAAARDNGVAYTTLHDRLNGKRAKDKTPRALDKPVVAGEVKPRAERRFGKPAKGEVFRYILTCAQNNTKVHDALWANLMALANHYGAQVLVSRFAYDTAAHRVTKPGTETRHEDLWYDPRIASVVCDERVELAPGLVFCGELNILPTAVRPLSGLETYTGRRSAIVPHVKIAMESIASGKYEPTKFCYTTGTVTQRNYIQKKAGQKAEFHHCYGALLVEVDSDGDWFVRQLNGDSEGVIYDLTLCAKNGKVTDGHRVEAVNWGDIHQCRLESHIEDACWGTNGVKRTLNPRYQFMHDVLDFRSRNHHDVKNPHAMFERHVLSQGDVSAEVSQVARFLALTMEPHTDCQTVVVDSNHDNALERWLREADFKTDPLNAVFYLKASLAKYEAMQKLDTEFHLLEWACVRQYSECRRVKFLREDEGFRICQDANGGIECGMHGHLGPNGARGSAGAFAKMGRKANVGHGHSTGIFDGIYTSGVMASLNLGYNRGPSSWSQSLILTYANGKRAIVTIWNKKWRANV